MRLAERQRWPDVAISHTFPTQPEIVHEGAGYSGDSSSESQRLGLGGGADWIRTSGSVRLATRDTSFLFAAGILNKDNKPFWLSLKLIERPAATCWR
jgi:hypothetical protein